MDTRLYWRVGVACFGVTRVDHLRSPSAALQLVPFTSRDDTLCIPSLPSPNSAAKRRLTTSWMPLETRRKRRQRSRACGVRRLPPPSSPPLSLSRRRKPISLSVAFTLSQAVRYGTPSASAARLSEP